VEAARGDLGRWSTRRPPLFSLAAYWARHGPRATSYLPRVIGRTFGRSWETIVETPDGIRFAVDPSNLDVYTSLLRQGGHERHVVAVCAALMRDQNVFYDVGASAGAFSLAIGARYPGSRVFAFEPQPSLALSTARSTGLNHLENVVVLATLVGSRDGQATLYLPGHSVHASTEAPEPGAREIESSMRRLDTLVEEGMLPKPDVVKIDVEGGERDVLVGAEATIRAHTPALVYEAIDELTQRFGYRPSDLIDLISSYADYEFFGISGSSGLVAQGEIEGDPDVRDVLALPPSRRSTFEIASITWPAREDPRHP